jgi:hypothetical protein
MEREDQAITPSPADPDRQYLPVKSGNGFRMERQNFPVTQYKNMHLRIHIKKYVVREIRFYQNWEGMQNSKIRKQNHN